MDDAIVAFLRARLDEREARAKACKTYEPEPRDYQWFTANEIFELGAPKMMDTEAAFIADQSPAFVLADVDAKRRLIAGHGPGRVVDESNGRWASDPDSWDPPWTKCTGHEWEAYPCELLRLLALPFAGHPEYQESWKP